MLLSDCITRLESLAPPALAEPWDNVGLLVGDRNEVVRRVMTCLTLTPDVAREALDEHVDLIVTHHPVLFRAVKQLTADTIEGAMLLSLIRENVAVYSPHTAYDSAAEGINQQLAQGLGLSNIVPLRPMPAADRLEISSAGGGRRGTLTASITLQELSARLGRLLRVGGTHMVGEPDRRVQSIAVACGAAGEFQSDAIRAGCDAFITGEARFHACLEARAAGIALVLPGHFATERPAVESLATRIAAEWSDVTAWASRCEQDPLRWSST
jgi:dinuclear metal center YbgI/SA1388 family protein